MASTDVTSNTKILTLAEIRKLAEDKDRCILTINNRVYDVTRFLEEHPGGEEVLKEQHGRDATNAFEDVGHSSDAREQMKQFEIAQVDPSDIKTPTRPVIAKPNGSTGVARDDAGLSWTKWVIPLVIAIAAAVLFKLLTKPEVNVNRPPTAI
ncbi:unnamed protein product [Rotaria sp. Silwood1]|nr:unnamed protein product [Rotaria sp. Silwood1]CAF1323095.1 unnamed protein product [Rotaria sp. Silwood1]CAF3492684.1 unnamed protein product [Rotaria sp. Silwood1]CAF3595355.1 unnamed protein product [Rotaria sp. Silwood1]CAF4613645.1 unnamed protein product [Rotaria sp. Silwood1]